MAEMHTIAILEDDPLIRDELVRIIGLDDSLTLLFTSETVADALLQFRAHTPDIMLVDMQLPDGSGLEIIRLARASGKLSLMLTVLADRASVMSALEEGAQGYLLKDLPASQICAAVRNALAGQSPISPQAATHILDIIRKKSESTEAVERLTERELTILNMIARGLTYAEAAQAAGISVHTVGDHVKSIYRKLDVNSKNEAIHEARQLGWLSRFD